MSAREELVERIYAKFGDYGLLSSPVSTGPELGQSRSGRPVRQFMFGIKRVMDGKLEVYGPKFIRIGWVMGTPWERSEVLRSEEEVYDWLESRGWMGYGQNGGSDDDGATRSGEEEGEGRQSKDIRI